MTSPTHCLLIHERVDGDRTGGPAWLQQVPSMMAAGNPAIGAGCVHDVPASAMDMQADTAIDWRFETPRVRARLIDINDRDLYRNLYTDPAVMAHIGPAMNAAAADALFEKVLGWNSEWPMRARFWRMAEASDSPIGLCSITRRKIAPDRIELGQMILPQRQSQRFGMEVALWIIDSLMSDRWGLGADDLIAHNIAANTRVNRIGVRLGFEQLGKDADAGHQETWRLTHAAWLANQPAWRSKLRTFSRHSETYPA